MSERREKYSAGIGQSKAVEPAGDVVEAIQRLLSRGLIVAIGPTNGGLYPYHIVITRLSDGSMVDYRCSDFASKLLELAESMPSVS